MATDQKLRETIIWLAGLISADGTVRYPNKKRGLYSLQYSISSKDKKWLKQIADKLSDVGIPTRIRENKSTDFYKQTGYIIYELLLGHPYRVTQLLIKHAEGFMISRKWERVASAYKTGKYAHWTPEEDAFLIAHYRTMYYTDIARKLGRCGPNSIKGRIRKLRKDGILPKENLSNTKKAWNQYKQIFSAF